MKTKSFLFLFLFLFFLNGSEIAPLDGILAVVENKPILHSDILQQTQMIAVQQNVDFSSEPSLFESIYRQVLSDMIDQYVVLAAAEVDTNISVSTKEVDTALERQIQDIILRAGSVKALEEALGSPLRKIKKEYWSEIRNMMLVERFRFSLMSKVVITRTEIETFFWTFKDSLPDIPEKFNFHVIELPIVPGSSAIEKTKTVLEKLRKKILTKESSFESLAIEFSEDPGSSSSGGDLGFMKRGSLVSEFEEVAFSLLPGEISPPTLSPFGFHLIQLIERKGEKIHTRHILKTVNPSEKDRSLSLDSIKNIYTAVQRDTSLFEKNSFKYKNQHKNLSGSYFLEEEKIPKKILENIKILSPNSFSTPFETENNSFMLIYYESFSKKETPSLENSWETVAELTKTKKMNENFIHWLDEQRSKTFIKIFN